METTERAAKMARHLFSGRPTLVYNPSLDGDEIIRAEDYIASELEDVKQEAIRGTLEGFCSNPMFMTMTGYDAARRILAWNSIKEKEEK